MIRLIREPRPAELTAELQKRLTEEYKKSGKAVWKQKWIKDALLKSSFGKCAFSEVKLEEEGKYMEVEHFHPKSLYPDEVLEWNNLLPISNVCNRKKKNLDTKRRPLVNPMEDNPQDYFYIKDGRICTKNANDSKAEDTILYYDLNNNDQFREKRFAIENWILRKLQDYATQYAVDKNRYASKLLVLMQSSGRTFDYSATKSTIILTSSDYIKLKEQMKADGKWTNDYIEAEAELEYCCLKP